MTARPTQAGPTTTIVPPPLGPSRIQYAIFDTLLGPPNGEAIPKLSHYTIPRGADFRPIGPVAPVAVPAAASTNAYEVWPSPSGDYTVVMLGGFPCYIPYIYRHQTGEVVPALHESMNGQFYGWHPDGRRFLFGGYGRYLWLIDPATGDKLPLAQTPYGQAHAAIAPNGATIAYSQEHSSLARLSIFLVNSDGRAERHLANDLGPLPAHPWAPDSRRLALNSPCYPATPVPKSQRPDGGGGGWTGAALCIIDTETGQRQPLLFPFYIEDGPYWSPDGRWLAFVSQDGPGRACRGGKNEPVALDDPCLYAGRTVFLLDVVTGQARPLTAGRNPAWSPDGSRLAFLSNRSGAPEVWMIDQAGQNAQQLTSDSQLKYLYTDLTWIR